MNFNNNPYDVIGVAIAEELFKQAETLYPIEDEPTPKKPSLLRRFVYALRSNNHSVAEDSTIRSHGEDCAAPKPI